MKRRNPVAAAAKRLPGKGGAHLDRKKQSKRKPKRIPLWCDPLEWGYQAWPKVEDE